MNILVDYEGISKGAWFSTILATRKKRYLYLYCSSITIIINTIEKQGMLALRVGGLVLGKSPTCSILFVTALILPLGVIANMPHYPFG